MRRTATPGRVRSAVNGGRLSLSRSDFVTAGGVRLEKRGVTPDVVVAQALDPDSDPALEIALAALADTGHAPAASPH